MTKSEKNTWLFCGVTTAILLLIVLVLACKNVKEKKEDVENNFNEEIFSTVVGNSNAEEETFYAAEDNSIVEEKKCWTDYNKTFGDVIYFDGIDISYCQENIDASKIGQKFVVIKMGGLGYGARETYVDDYFYINLKKVYENNLNFALYWASYSENEMELNKEIDEICRILSELPSQYREKIKFLFIDRENQPGFDAKANPGMVNNITIQEFKSIYTAQIKRLQSRLEDIYVGIYTNIDFLSNKIDFEAIGNVPIWISWYSNNVADFTSVIDRTANYPKEITENSRKVARYLEENIVMWQYSFSGQVSGVNGNVDLNLVSSKMLG